MLLPGCVVWEASPAWLATVCPVSKLPVKRIISGNDYWHCLPWLMATSQYLTSHHLLQGRCEELVLWQMFVIHFKRGMWLWVGMSLLNLLRYEVITGLRSELVCIESRTGCWVTCFMADMPVTAGHNRVSSYRPALFHTTLVTHCSVQRGHVGSQLSWAKKSCMLCVHGTETCHKKQWAAFIYQRAHKSSSAFPFARWNTMCSFSEMIPKYNSNAVMSACFNYDSNKENV